MPRHKKPKKIRPSVFDRLGVDKHEAAEEILRIKKIRQHGKWKLCKYEWSYSQVFWMVRALQKEGYKGFEVEKKYVYKP